MFGFFARKGPFSAQIMPSGQSFEVKASENLLKAALENGVAWPHNCRVGSCGTCRARLVRGDVKELNDFSYVLTPEELDKGMILACQTSLRSDVVIEVALEQAEGRPAEVKSVAGVISSSVYLTHDIIEVRVRLEQSFPQYLAGQYAEISAPGIEKPRSYSFARAPENEDDHQVSFHVRHVPGGAMTGWLYFADRVGERVTVTGPYGSFWVRESEAPMLCIAGGSGMAPIKAMLEHVSSHGFGRQVTYLFGARTQQDLYCMEEMNRIKARGNGHFRFIPILSHEPEDSNWAGPRGFVTEYITRQDLDLPSCHAYLCGPPPMIDAAIEVLTKSRVDSENIYFDKFLDASYLPGGRG